MPMQSQSSVEIHRPIEEVFDVTTRHVAEWSIVVVEDEVIEETPDGVGSRFRVVTEDHGCRTVFDGVVTRNERPRLQAIRMTSRQFDIEATYTFEDLGGKTRVTQDSTVYPKGFFKVFLGVFGWMMKKSSCDALRKELESLKQFAESGGSTTPTQGV